MKFFKQINDCIQIKLFQESDTRCVIDFINSFKKNDKIFLSENIYVNDQLLNDNEYSEINIRANLYEYYEEFVGIIDNDELKLIIAVSINKNNKSKSLNLNLICGDSIYFAYLRDAFDFIDDTLSECSIIQPTKLITYLLTNHKFTEKWEDRLLNAGFEIQAIRENEKSVGKSITALIKNFERNQ